MKKPILLNILAIVTLLLGLLSACVPGSSVAAQGKLVLKLTDAPINADEISGVYIKINGIEVNKDGEWIVLEDFEGPQTYNLLDYTAGKSALLGEFDLGEGIYSQIRFILDIQEQTDGVLANPGCYVEFTDQTTKPLFVPSGGQSGYKAIGDFEVPINGEVTITVDFDVRKALHMTGQPNNPKYILNPTLRLIVEDQAGSISGTATNNSSYSDLVIYVYENGSWIDTEDNNSEAMFPNTVTSIKVSSDGSYKLAFLAAGKYDLVVAGYNGDTYGEILGYVSDVEVVSEQVTNLDFDTNTLATTL